VEATEREGDEARRGETRDRGGAREGREWGRKGKHGEAGAGEEVDAGAGQEAALVTLELVEEGSKHGGFVRQGGAALQHPERRVEQPRRVNQPEQPFQQLRRVVVYLQ
jgi:hypothetical protein